MHDHATGVGFLCLCLGKGLWDERKVDELEADRLIHVVKAIVCSWEYRYDRALKIICLDEIDQSHVR